ncbi:hypothetical protein PDIG_68450 [Penicillium digitatum PHI26]|uniref:Uncharacterized protein n=2 Tax=Penicillium digitatum TaxID=36651 RepID=K9FFP2_PEND2|nr:hypothetical protein PDIP_77740 [Penicillium digitatum Pd1]EKV06649.1 hypothetical protein PDIP_77740 [Penicillium digitatum Pd1]EKV08270.1 hypothetical protein PDIG_68450 [Penicillium digitatum PHI26]
MFSSTVIPCCVQPNYESPQVVVTATAQAMCTAKSNFFHRRIHEVDPIALQGNVATIQGYLVQK